MSSPRVLCVCPTAPGREGLACRAMICFAEQAYADKSLLVLTRQPEQHAELCAWADCLRQQGADICVQMETRPQKLWQRYAMGLEAAVASQSLVAIWDDDNLYHPLYLSYMVGVGVNRKAAVTVLSGSTMRFMDSGEWFTVDVQRRGQPASKSSLPMLGLYDPSRVRFMSPVNAEQHPAHQLLWAAERQKLPIRVIADQWWWTVLGVRGDNFSGYKHHRYVAETCGKPVGLLREWQPMNDYWLRDLRRDGDGEVMCGPDGIAYPLSKSRVSWPDDIPPVGQPIDGVERVTQALE